MKTTHLYILCILILSSCNNSGSLDQEYLREMDEWKSKRIENLKSETGWLNLAGLFWLVEGENSFGSASDNKIIFPESAAEHFGIILKSGDSISILVNENVKIIVDEVPIRKMHLKTDRSDYTTIMEWESFTWFIIKRESGYAIRLRDFKNPNIDKLQSIPSYPISSEWIKTAEYIPFEVSQQVEVANMVGGTDSYEVPGKIVFKHKRKSYELLPFKAGKGFFIIIGDLTSAIETYASGRYMYVDAPDENNNLSLDFNKAYNPPCAFTEFATCPLPPEENRLDLAITAGEKGVHLGD